MHYGRLSTLPSSFTSTSYSSPSSPNSPSSPTSYSPKVQKAAFVGESPLTLGFSAKLDLAKPIEILDRKPTYFNLACLEQNY